MPVERDRASTGMRKGRAARGPGRATRARGRAAAQASRTPASSGSCTSTEAARDDRRRSDREGPREVDHGRRATTATATASRRAADRRRRWRGEGAVQADRDHEADRQVDAEAVPGARQPARHLPAVQIDFVKPDGAGGDEVFYSVKLGAGPRHRRSTRSTKGRRTGTRSSSVSLDFQSIEITEAAAPPPAAAAGELSRSGCGGFGRRSLHEHEIAVLRVDADRVALAEVAFEQPQRERVLEQPLDRALQRPRAVGRVPARRRRSPASPRRSARARARARRAARAGAPSCSSTISPSCSRESGLNSTISSIRFRNSGRKWSRIASALRMFDVMISTALRKSTVRPWPSVSRPSSSTCSSTSNTSACAFSISSSRTTQYGRRRTASVSWPPSS